MDPSTPNPQQVPPSKNPPSKRAVLIRVAVWILVVAVLSISARRDEWMCPECTSTKDTVSWRILFVIPLSQREENLQEKSAGEHTHEWTRHAYRERMLLGLLLKGVP
jgi:hypothetical protein